MKTLEEINSTAATVNHAEELTPEVAIAIWDMFTYHEWNDDQKERGSLVRQILSTAVQVIVTSVPPGPDRTRAINCIRDARLHSNSAITFNGRY